jgi:hypothetical protein
MFSVLIMASSDLDERNFRNLVRFYREGLRRVAGGDRATEVFMPYERGKLREFGILRYKNRTWTITEKAKKCMDL